MSQGRHLRLVTTEDTERRNTLMEHPAFDGLQGSLVARLSTEDLQECIHTWERHTERGVAWVEMQRATRDS